MRHNANTQYYHLKMTTLRSITDLKTSLSKGTFDVCDDITSGFLPIMGALYTNQIVNQLLLQKAFTVYQSSYGYGWMIIDRYGKKTVQHGGGITGFASYILRVPGDQICIIVLTNVASDAPSKIANEINGMFNGKTDHLVLYQSGQKMTAIKLGPKNQ